MIKNILLIPKIMIDNLQNKFTLKRKRVIYGSGLKINGIIKLHGDGKIIIGNRVRINSSEESNPIGGMERTIFAAYGIGVIMIGNDVGISNVAINCKEAVTIGNNVLIGGNVKIYDSDFHSIDYTKRGKGVGIDKPVIKPVIIKSDAFIGSHTIILKGVTIGERTIIGAGSVVTKSIPDDEIWAGNPARFIRKVFEN